MPRRAKMRGGGPAVTTAVEGSIKGAPVGSRFLLATAHGSMRVHALPHEGDVILGRGEECQVVIDYPSISRQHARLRVGATCTLADLGSRNGTQFRGERLAPGQEQALATGDAFTIGPCSLLLIPLGASSISVAVAGSRLRVEDPSGVHASELLVAVAQAPVNVIIYGETGSGKEVLAATLHRLSGRSGPMLGINCATLSDTLLESELFGYERGAFTGAVQPKPGLLQAAAGGTVLLDEIGDMAPGIQAKLLRAIEAREILRVGAVRPVPIDVRFLAATHRNLLALSEKGGFRRDLYYRLAGFALEIPPLRDRTDQLAVLATQIVIEAAARAQRKAPAISAAASAALAAHDWPGNVRELRNVMERALLLARGSDIRPEHIIIDAPAEEPAAAPDDDERSRILAALEACAGNQTRAARMLGMARTTFVQLLKLHAIPRPRTPR